MGEYEQARRLYSEVLRNADSLATMNLVHFAETFLATGEYEEGLAAVEEYVGDGEGNPFALHARGLFLEAAGQYEAAERAYLESARLKEDLWPNILALAEILDKTGRDSEANDVFTYIYRPFKNNEFRTAEELGIAARAASFIGEFRDANSAFRTAYQIDPSHPRNLYWWGELFRIKYNDADAQRTFEEGIQANPNYASMYAAQARSVNGFAQKEQLALIALEKNPRHAEALGILAGLHILDGLYDRAEELLSQALEINPSHEENLGHLASVHFLRDETAAFEQVEQRALEVNPRAGLFYITLARNCDLKFRYPDAVAFGEQAVQVDRRNPEAYAQLGTSLLRLGNADEARRYLDFSFENDPFNLFVGNMLTLLDEFEDFALLESEHFSLLIHRDEKDVLGPAILELAEQSYTQLSRRYPYVPAERILLEAYNDPDDFAVRIAGVPHLGLLGVSFGDVLAFNTPRTMVDGNYNWARTLWHELVHTMTIGLSNYRMPRWFAEGLAVYEEQRARPEWAREMQIDFLLAFEQERLLPLTEMDRGFTRPTFPGQVLLSYYHASRIVGFIADRFGDEALTEILVGFAEGKNDARSIQDVTGLSLAEVDQAFQEMVKQEREALADVLRGMPDPFAVESPGPLASALFQNELMNALRDGYEDLDKEAYAASERHFLKALSLYDRYVEPGNAYQGLAVVYRAQGDEEKLMDILSRYLAISEYGAEESVELAALLEKRGESNRAVSFLERSLQVDPYQREVHSQLAELYTRQGRHGDAVRAWQAILGLNPVDRAEAYYQFALSLYASNRRIESKRAVLQSLELAPGYRDAQKLLLDLVEP